MAHQIRPESVPHNHAADPARASRTGELGSEGGSYGELTQSIRASLGDTAEAAPRSSAALTVVLVLAGVLLILLVVWFGSLVL